MKPIVHGLEADYFGRVDVIYIDRENPNNQDIVKMYDVFYQPVFILIQPDGTQVARWAYFDEADIRARLDEIVASR